MDCVDFLLAGALPLEPPAVGVASGSALFLALSGYLLGDEVDDDCRGRLCAGPVELEVASEELGSEALFLPLRSLAVVEDP